MRAAQGPNRLTTKVIAFEWPNSCGKTTLMASVLKALVHRQIKHKRLKFPSHGSIVKLCREYASSAYQPHTLTCLVAAEFYRYSAEEIIPGLSLESDVLCERYVMSSYVYQGMHGVAIEFIDKVFSSLVLSSIYFVLRAYQQNIVCRRTGVTDDFERFENIADELRRYEAVSDMMRRRNIRVETFDAEQSIKEQISTVLKSIL
jgi:thymidylate kinase